MAARKGKGSPRDVEVYGTMLIVRDIAESVAFYRGKLRIKGETAGPWAELHNQESRLVLLERGFWAKATGTRLKGGAGRKGESVVIALKVPDVTREHRRLTSEGIAFELPPTVVPPMGVRIALLRDPDGHLVELSTMLTREDLEPSQAPSR